MTIKAIETVYNGYRFRSRLEARWAVFFDAVGVQWKYEPEGFERAPVCGPDSEVIRYLPDFHLPQTNTWVEIKGTPEALIADGNKLAEMLDWGSPIPGIAGSYSWDRRSHFAPGLLVLGDIPYMSNDLHLFPLVQHSKGLQRVYAAWVPSLTVISDPTMSLLSMVAGVENKSWQHDSISGGDSWGELTTVSVESKWHYPLVTGAFRKSRQSRFEFGQTPSREAK